MTETGVDLAWREITSQTSQALPDSHPLVQLERSIWEVKAAGKLVLDNLEDLNMHKSLQKRVQVLTTAVSALLREMTEESVVDKENIISTLPEVPNRETTGGSVHQATRSGREK